MTDADESDKGRINEPPRRIDFGANLPFNLLSDSLDGAASATSSEPVVLPDETRRRASLSAPPLQSCSASRYTIKPHPRHDSKQLQLMCGTTIAAVNKLTQQENKEKTKKKKRAEHATNRQFGQTEQSSFDSRRVQNVSGRQFSLAKRRNHGLEVFLGLNRDVS